MSALFDSFPENPGSIASATPRQSEEHVDYSWIQRMEKSDKKIRKLKKKQKKLLKQISELKALQAAEEQRRAEEDIGKKQSTLAEWSNTIRKAIPGIISIISAVVAGFFSRRTTVRP